MNTGGAGTFDEEGKVDPENERECEKAGRKGDGGWLWFGVANVVRCGPAEGGPSDLWYEGEGTEFTRTLSLSEASPSTPFDSRCTGNDT